MLRFAPSSLLALVLIAGCMDSTAPERIVPGEILFLSNQLDGTLDFGRVKLSLHAIGMTGEGERTVASRPSTNFGFDVSRDGKRIVMYGMDWDIWTTDVEGTEPVRLTNLGATQADWSNYGARWSRDGNRIAFLSNRDRRQHGSAVGVYDVYVMHADGSNPRNVSDALGGLVGFSPIVLGWTPGGEVIVQTNDVVSGAWHRQVYALKPDGSGFRALLAEGDAHAVFSPDGARVLFQRVENQVPRVYMMNADGTGARVASPEGDAVLETQSGDGSGLRSPWSPDGQRFIFRRTGTNPGLYVLNIDGTGLRRVVTDYDARFGSWSPAGDRIAFTRGDDIHTIGIDGTDPQNVTRSDGVTDLAPVWLRGN